jgi:transposase-like protein
LGCDSVLRRWVELRGAGREPTAAARRPTTQATLPSADHAAEIARLQRENERLRMERDILKNCPAAGPLDPSPPAPGTRKVLVSLVISRLCLSLQGQIQSRLLRL